MKINSVSRKFKTWIRSLWTPRVDVDFLELDYALMGEVNSLNDQRLDELIAQRNELKRKKKKTSHIQAEIERLRTDQLRRL